MRSLRLLCSLLLVVAACSTQARSERAARPTSPNVLLVVTDDERVNSHVATPRLYDWFGQGSIFTRAYATTPHCCPSRASILTGQYTHNHNVPRPRLIERLDHNDTLQVNLGKAGYQTGFVGKYVNGWPGDRQPPGFDFWTIGDGYYEDGLFFADGVRHEPDYGPTYVFEKGIDYLRDWEDKDTQPWFLMLAPATPHAPYFPEPQHSDETFGWKGTPATKETDVSDKPQYVRDERVPERRGADIRERQLRTLRSVDSSMMEMLRYLEKQGELEDTLVIYLSDNGFMWAEHGLMGKGYPYDGSVRVPIYARGPGVPKQRSDKLVANIDVAPTIYETTGVEPRHPMDGRPLFGAKGRERLLLEFSGGDIPEWSSIVTRGSQYIEYADGTREFYDLENDPHQLTSSPDRVPSELVDALRSARTCAGRSCP